MEESTIYLVRYCLSCTAFVTILLHWKFFWKERRLFPTLPLFRMKGFIFPLWCSRILFISELLVLLCIGFVPISWVSYFAYYQLLWGVFWCIMEENIWCPQIAHFNMMAISLIVYDSTSLKIWTIFLYIFGGIQKLNYKFVKDGRGIMDFIYPICKNLKISSHVLKVDYRYYFEIIAILSGISEFSLGIGLLFLPTQAISSMGIVILHIIILLCVGPFGANNFHGIWAWNLMCMFITPGLFFSPTQQSPIIGIIEQLSVLNLFCWISFILWGFFPILNLINGYWPDPLSFKLHSYNFSRAELVLSGKPTQPVPNLFLLARFINRDGVIDTTRLAFEYSNSPCCTCKGAVTWAQYLSDFVEYPILVNWNSSPHFLTGKRTLYRYVCRPSTSPVFLGVTKLNY